MSNDIPLIYTSKGNLPEADLRMEVEWFVADEYVKVVKRHYLGDELVKEGADVLSFKGAIGETLIGIVK